MPDGERRRPAAQPEQADPSGADLLTLQEAADRLKVHYMTAYRWIRKGELPAFKTGGRLRVRADDLADFMAQRAVDTVMPREGQRTDWPTHIERLHESLRHGDGVGATSLVRKVVADGAPIGDVYLRLLTPALQRIGDEWAQQEICVSEEHRATEIADAIIKRHSEAFRRRGPRRGTAVSLAAPGDLHSLGAAMVADFMRVGGYDVSFLGADVPTDDLATFLRGEPADVVCVSVTMPGLGASAYSDMVDAARGPNQDAVVLFGGQSADASSARSAGGEHGADLSALNAQVAELTRL